MGGSAHLPPRHWRFAIVGVCVTEWHDAVVRLVPTTHAGAMIADLAYWLLLFFILRAELGTIAMHNHAEVVVVQTHRLAAELSWESRTGEGKTVSNKSDEE